MENVKEFAEYAKPKSTQRAIDGLHVYSMPAEFLKEGTLFMNRCTSMAHSLTLRYFPDTLLMVCRARQEGIHPHLASSRNRFLDHGSVIMAPSYLISQNTADSDNRSHRLHCQADPHPRKQHPRWRLIVPAHPSIPNTPFFHFRIPFGTAYHSSYYLYCTWREPGQIGSTHQAWSIPKTLYNTGTG
jgi:hypothetical protein